MKKNLLLSLVCGALLVPATAVAQLAPTTCGTDWQNADGAHGRHLNAINLTGGVDGTTSITSFDTSNTHATYNDCTSEIFNANAGATIDWEATSTGTVHWTHFYMYIDYNNNGTFEYNLNDDYTPAEGSELVAYTFYSPNDTSLGYDSTGSENSGNQNAGVGSTYPSFTLPADLANGQYRMRLKMDWNSLDPCGNSDPSNLIYKNSGYIIDFTLQVGEGAGVDKVNGDNVALYYNDGAIYTNAEGEIAIYDLAGKLVRRANAAPVAVDDLASGAYIVKANGKTVKFVK